MHLRESEVFRKGQGEWKLINWHAEALNPSPTD
jgi:hypothetical protein